MRTTTLTASVVICVHVAHRLPDIDKAIDSLRNQSRAPYEIVIAVDHNLALFEILKDRYGGVTVVASTGTKGLSGARNSGIAATTGDVILFLDDDAVAEYCWIEQMIQPMEREESVDIVSGRTLPAWDTARPRWFPAEFDWTIGATYAGMPREQRAVRNPFGGNAAWRRRVFDTVGGFSEGVGRNGADFAGCEETELSIRYRQARRQATVIYTPDATIHHRVPVDRAHWGYFLRRCWAEGKSKALISSMVGTNQATHREVGYVLSVLAPAVVREISSAVRTGTLTPLMRVGAIALGLGSTSTAFVRGRAGSAVRRVVHPALTA